MEQNETTVYGAKGNNYPILSEKGRIRKNMSALAK